MTNGVLSYWSGRLLGFPRAKARFGHAVCMGAGTLLACGGWFSIYTVSLSSGLSPPSKILSVPTIKFIFVPLKVRVYTHRPTAGCPILRLENHLSG